MQGEAARARLDLGGDRRRPVAQLRLDTPDRRVQAPSSPHLAAGERLARPDDERVRARLGAQGVERDPGRDADALPLARGEAPVARVPSELAPGGVHDRALTGLEAVALEEGAVVVAGQEARLLTLGARGDREPRLGGLGPRLLLVLVAEREPEPAEPPRIERGEHVRLVLVRI